MSNLTDRVELRPLAATDRAAIRDLIAAANRADGVPQVPTLDEVAEDLDDDHVVLATDARAAVAPDSTIVGYVYAYHLPSDVQLERCYLFGDVHPDWRGRGVGSALLAWGRQRAEELLRSSPHDLPKYIRVDAYDYLAADHRLFASQGFRPVRYFEELLRPLSDRPARPDPDAIDGVRIVSWPIERNEEVRLAKNVAFADHWGSTPSTAQQWRSMTTGYGGDLAHSFVALDTDDRVVGHCLNSRYPDDDALIGRSDGWIDSLGTLPEWRGRGVASALIVTSLHAFADAGYTHASIGVDSANPTGAHQLYRRLGFEPRQRSITHEIELA